MAAAAKRKPESVVPPEKSDFLRITSLGAGQEDGRSCHILEFKGKKVMLSSNHCGSLPWFLEKTTFKGRVFVTHAIKAIHKYNA